MEAIADPSAIVVPAMLEREMTLIRSAIALVESGASRRVVVAGIRFGDTLLDPARRLALESGVRIEPLWSADEACTDLAVERIGP